MPHPPILNQTSVPFQCNRLARIALGCTSSCGCNYKCCQLHDIRMAHRPLYALLQAATAVRESLYTGGYLGVMPALRDVFAAQPSFQQLPDGSATIAAGVTAGLLAATASQPADTIKTRMQVHFLSG